MTSPGIVFISSVQGDDFDGIRTSAREAAERLGWTVRMAETAPGTDDTARATIQRLIDEADVQLTLIGARAGTILDNGLSVVEDEYGMAAELGTPVIPVLQEGVVFEAHQERFIERIRGDWESGHWAPKRFSGPGDVGLGAVAPALVEFERRSRTTPEDAMEPLAREALETILDAADRANQKVVGAVIDAIIERRGRTDDISFRTMFDLLCETPEFYADLGELVTTEAEAVGRALISAGYLLGSQHVEAAHREALIGAQVILRRIRDRAGEANFLAATQSEKLADQLRSALDEMHDGLFDRQRLLSDVKLALLEAPEASP